MHPPDGSPRDMILGHEARFDDREQCREVDSRTLLGPDDKLVIHHEGRRYMLRRTRLGKLILTT
ncbi:hemin uptake protein HemP [Billgrantia montanilacus]|nr:hemin uptake protein HemP [Halomonas montanilacus]